MSAALGVMAFLLAGASLALVLGSGAQRFTGHVDQPALLYAGLACFVGFCVLGLVVRLMSPDRPPLEGRFGWKAAIALLVVPTLIGFAIDAAT
jgi:hypothetical protein